MRQRHGNGEVSQCGCRGPQHEGCHGLHDGCHEVDNTGVLGAELARGVHVLARGGEGNVSDGQALARGEQAHARDGQVHDECHVKHKDVRDGAQDHDVPTQRVVGHGAVHGERHGGLQQVILLHDVELVHGGLHVVTLHDELIHDSQKTLVHQRRAHNALLVHDEDVHGDVQNRAPLEKDHSVLHVQSHAKFRDQKPMADHELAHNALVLPPQSDHQFPNDE